MVLRRFAVLCALLVFSYTSQSYAAPPKDQFIKTLKIGRDQVNKAQFDQLVNRLDSIPREIEAYRKKNGAEISKHGQEMIDAVIEAGGVLKLGAIDELLKVLEELADAIFRASAANAFKTVADAELAKAEALKAAVAADIKAAEPTEVPDPEPSEEPDPGEEPEDPPVPAPTPTKTPTPPPPTPSAATIALFEATAAEWEAKAEEIEELVDDLPGGGFSSSSGASLRADLVKARDKLAALKNQVPATAGVFEGAMAALDYLIARVDVMINSQECPDGTKKQREGIANIADDIMDGVKEVLEDWQEFYETLATKTKDMIKELKKAKPKLSTVLSSAESLISYIKSKRSSMGNSSQYTSKIPGLEQQVADLEKDVELECKFCKAQEDLYDVYKPILDDTATYNDLRNPSSFLASLSQDYFEQYQDELLPYYDQLGLDIAAVQAKIGPPASKNPASGGPLPPPQIQLNKECGVFEIDDGNSYNPIGIGAAHTLLLNAKNSIKRTVRVAKKKTKQKAVQCKKKNKKKCPKQLSPKIVKAINSLTKDYILNIQYNMDRVYFMLKKRHLF